jgi:hypothetical protein
MLNFDEDHFSGGQNLNTGSRSGFDIPILPELLQELQNSVENIILPTHIVYVDKYSISPVENGSISSPFKTIQGAVDYVSPLSSATSLYQIRVANGTYNESILVTHNGAFFSILGSHKYFCEIVAPSGPAICVSNATEESIAVYHTTGDYADLQPQSPPVAGPSAVFISGIKLKATSSNFWACVEALGVKGDYTADTTQLLGTYGFIIEDCLIQLTSVGTYRYAYFRNATLVQLLGNGSGNGGSNSYVEFFNSAYITIQRDIPRIKATYNVADPYGRSRYDRCEITAKNTIISAKHEFYGGAKFDVWGASSPYAGSTDITMNDTSQLRLFGTALYGALYINDNAIATLLGTSIFSNVTLEALASFTASASYIKGNLVAPLGAGVVTLSNTDVEGTITDSGGKITHKSPRERSGTATSAGAGDVAVVFSPALSRANYRVSLGNIGAGGAVVKAGSKTVNGFTLTFAAAGDCDWSAVLGQ